MTNSLAEWFANNLGTVITPQLLIFLVSMLPILELRGGLIVASLLHVPMWQAIPICVLGNIIPIPFVLLFFNAVIGALKKTRLFRRPAEALEQRALSRSDAVEKGEFVGLLVFVGIPLPGTGAWTGSMIAALLHIDRKKAVPAILLGVLMACVIMTVVSYGILGQVF